MKELVGNGSTLLILSLPLASCLFSQKCIFPVETLLKTACIEFKCGGEIATEDLYPERKQHRISVSHQYFLTAERKSTCMAFLKPQKSLTLAHKHTYLCISDPRVGFGSIGTLSPSGIQQWVGLLWLCFFILSNAWRWSMYIMHDWYNLRSWIFYWTNL